MPARALPPEFQDAEDRAEPPPAKRPRGPRWKRIALLTFYAALGPITGPLAAGFVRNWGKGDRVLAVLYLMAIPSGLSLLSFAVAWAGRWALG